MVQTFLPGASTLRARGTRSTTPLQLGARSAWFDLNRYRTLARLVSAALGLAAGAALPAQDSLRLSLAGDQAAAARRAAARELDCPNLRFGPGSARLAAGLRLEANDNLRAAAQDPESDLLFRPALDAQLRLPLSGLNALSLSLAAGYAFYVQHPAYDRPFVTPGSELAFDLYLPDVWVAFHDRFAIVENAFLDPTVTGLADYERLDNAAGCSALWDLNRLCLTVGYDHQTYASLTHHPTDTDGQSDVFSASCAWVPNPGLRAGVEAGGALLHYTAAQNTALFSDGTQWNLGLFLQHQLSDYLYLRAAAGYSAFRPQAGLASSLHQDFSGGYAQLSALHRLNHFLDYSLSAGRMLNSSFYGGLLDQYFTRLDANWRLIRKTTITTSLSWQHGSQLGYGAEQFNWFGPGLSATRQFGPKFSLSLSYQWYRRDSDLPNRDYSANVVAASGLYKF